MSKIKNGGLVWQSVKPGSAVKGLLIVISFSSAPGDFVAPRSRVTKCQRSFVDSGPTLSQSVHDLSLPHYHTKLIEH